MSIFLTHKNPTAPPPIVFDYFGDKVEPLLCLNYNMFKDHNSVAEALSRNPGERREVFVHCVRRDQWTTREAKRDNCATVLYRIQWAVSSVIFSPSTIL